MAKQIDFLAIGDITTDAFIRIKDASVNCDINKENCKLCVSFGEKIPYEFVKVVKAVGNSANAAVAASRLGLSSGLITDIGADLNGKECVASLKKEGVNTKLVSQHKGMETNYHYVLWYEEERTIFIKHQEYPYALPKIKQPPKWIYFSSVAPNSLNYHTEIVDYVRKNKDETKLVFQPGTFQIKLGAEKLKDLYSLTEIFFCNVEEAKKITGQQTSEIRGLLQGVHALGPKIVVITDGPKGAHSFDGRETWFMPMYPDPKPPYERTGAGDAFASTFTIALALGKSIPEALAWGPINSMSVVQYVGAQEGLLRREKLEEYLKNAPENYKPQKIS